MTVGKSHALAACAADLVPLVWRAAPGPWEGGDTRLESYLYKLSRMPRAMRCGS